MCSYLKMERYHFDALDSIGKCALHAHVPLRVHARVLRGLAIRTCLTLETIDISMSKNSRGASSVVKRTIREALLGIAQEWM